MEITFNEHIDKVKQINLVLKKRVTHAQNQKTDQLYIQKCNVIWIRGTSFLKKAEHHLGEQDAICAMIQKSNKIMEQNASDLRSIIK